MYSISVPPRSNILLAPGGRPEPRDLRAAAAEQTLRGVVVGISSGLSGLFGLSGSSTASVCNSEVAAWFSSARPQSAKVSRARQSFCVDTAQGVESAAPSI